MPVPSMPFPDILEVCEKKKKEEQTSSQKQGS
jgi:hypothetical protein